MEAEKISKAILIENGVWAWQKRHKVTYHYPIIFPDMFLSRLLKPLDMLIG